MSRAAGFTLLELLVSLVVLGFILAGLTQGVRYGLRASATQARLVETRGELDAVDRAIRRLLADADPGNAHDGPTLHGAAAELVFVSDLPAGASGTVQDLSDMALLVDPGHRFILRYGPHLHAQRVGTAPAPGVEELLRGVERVEFAYWSDGWRARWDEAALPALIRVRVVFPPGDLRHWPDIVVAPVRTRLE